MSRTPGASSSFIKLLARNDDNGLNISLRHTLGVERVVVSPGHSISIGFDVAPRGRPSFDFCALTFFPRRA
jgi:hypothetical protein